MSQLNTGHMKFGSGPQGSCFIFGLQIPFDFTEVAVDTKPGMGLVPSTGTYTDGCDRCDTSGDITKVVGIKDVQTAPDTEPTGDPRDHIATIGDQSKGLLWIPGNAYWVRCKDSSNNAVFGSSMIFDTTNCGMKVNADAAVIDSGSTAVTSSAANGAIITGNNVPDRTAMALKARTASATESWVPVLAIS